MDRPWYSRKRKVLWGAILLAIAYSALVYSVHSLTGIRLLDGGIGVMLGLYICSHPAANAIDLLFAERGVLHQLSSEWSGVGWLTLNMVVLLAGWLVIVIGAGQFVGAG